MQKQVFAGNVPMLDGSSPIEVRFFFVVSFLLSIRDLLNILDFQYWFAAVIATSSCDGIGLPLPAVPINLIIKARHESGALTGSDSRFSHSHLPDRSLSRSWRPDLEIEDRGEHYVRTQSPSGDSPAPHSRRKSR